MSAKLSPKQLKQGWGVEGVFDIKMASDAAIPGYSSVLNPNSGIPFIFSTWSDPRVIDAIITPTKMEETYGVSQKGDWLTDTAQFPFTELSGRVETYGDYSQGGDASATANWEQRQSYHYQLWTKWGEKEAARMGLAKIDWVNKQNAASISVLNKASNRISGFGIQGLRLYGALNDPDLPPAIQPTPKIDSTGKPAASNGWMSTSDPLQVYADVQKMFQQLTVQLGGNVDMDTPMKLVIPTELQVAMTFTNQFNLKLREVLKENFPNMEIATLPEAGATLSGGISKITQAQLFVKEIDGHEVVTTAFTEKLRAHTVERYSSNIRQKKSQGNWGTIWFYPVACVTMAGI
ncbi:DUF2184 domain-containing protein [Acetobacteraceae bacterium]|nr:DUF2184 domain-containing protein [Acetobacteraceae bacterium]